ncbi:PIG-L deacetylase family protein [Dyadobacter sp. CY347]|uniref:PIG-L deacetylase family protein n=1 Tax=Dyadobacter sp. CY347 TaxID=2909336 RepID=UPI001F1EEA68|nr:PIG-L family deacetylase [Dyadobacter sp. CY347]MCF2491423.1 PIG-L family deacetylase [Dyadobacter sp. CY347]
MRKILFLPFLMLWQSPAYSQNAKEAGKTPLKIIVFGAHPDDCDLGAGGVASIYSTMGHKVKFVSLTNGDAGHQDIGGGELARRRLGETQEVAKRLGIEYDVLDNHDGELFPTLENRLSVIRKIREWNADVVIAPRTNDYHPDHRNTGVIVQDASYLVIVPNILSSVPPLVKNPVFLYFRDRFQRPNPFRPDIAIDITTAITKKVDGLDAHVSQFYEWLPWTNQDLANVPKGLEERKKWLLTATEKRSSITPEIKLTIEKWYGKEQSEKIKFVEVFEITEYGKQPSPEEIRRLFPMLPQGN